MGPTLLLGCRFRPVEPISEDEFEALVVDALDRLPDELHDLLDNVVLMIADEHPDEGG